MKINVNQPRELIFTRCLLPGLVTFQDVLKRYKNVLFVKF